MRVSVALSGLVLLGLVSCLVLSLVLAIPVPGLGDSGDDPETPEAAARRVACGSGVEGLDFRVRDRIPRPSGVVILYDARCPSGTGRGAGQRFASAAVVLDLVRWDVKIGGRGLEDRYWSADPDPTIGLRPPGEGLPPASSGPFISSEGDGVSGWSRGVGNYDYLSGRVIEPTRVAAIEAVLGNGDTVRGDATRGVWVLFALESRIHEVRALDRDGRVIQRIDMRFDM